MRYKLWANLQRIDVDAGRGRFAHQCPAKPPTGVAHLHRTSRHGAGQLTNRVAFHRPASVRQILVALPERFTIECVLLAVAEDEQGKEAEATDPCGSAMQADAAWRTRRQGKSYRRA